MKAVGDIKRYPVIEKDTAVQSADNYPISK
jgi:hypothetical protein